MNVVMLSGKYLLKPNGKDALCFELHEWRESVQKSYGNGPKKGQKYMSEAGWKFTGAYPTTLQRGCELILERFALSGEDTLELNQAVSRLQDMTNQIKGAVDGRHL